MVTDDDSAVREQGVGSVTLTTRMSSPLHHLRVDQSRSSDSSSVMRRR